MFDLTILTPSLIQRRYLFQRLAGILQPQIERAGAYKVQWLVDSYDINDADRPSIGEARNRLAARAQGKYQCCIDDDDVVAADYVAKILEFMQYATDAILFEVEMKRDGGQPERGVFGLDYQVAKTDHVGGQKIGDKMVGGTITHYRYPNHLCPIRRDVIRQAKASFPSADFGEDSRFSDALRGHLHTVATIPPPPLYFYDYKSVKEYTIRGRV
jgi:Glycosyl transferase family 2